jgi:hypothetical protein
MRFGKGLSGDGVVQRRRADRFLLRVRTRSETSAAQPSDRDKSQSDLCTNAHAPIVHLHISDSCALAGAPGTDENVGAALAGVARNGCNPLDRLVDVGSAWCHRARISVRRESLGHPELLL